MKKINFKRIMPIILFVLLLLLILISIKLYRKQNIITKDEVYKQMQAEMVMPNGIFELKKNYEGDYDLKDFYKSIRDFSGEIIILSKKDEKNLEKYYKKHEKEIKRTANIKTYEEFKLLKEYSRSKGKLKSLVRANIDTDSFKSNKKYLEFDLTLIFDSDRELKFHVQLMNKESYGKVAKYQILNETNFTAEEP